MTNFINEVNVDGLKDVKLIRHYTTGSALKSILKNGYIEARESKGDADWSEHALIDRKVVSFHDVRTDPEWETFKKNNKEKISMEGMTPTLGIHDKKVCACIEINYEKIDKLIQDRTHLLKLYDKAAEDFCNLWNEIVSNTCKLDVLNLLKDIGMGEYDEEMETALKLLFKNINKNWYLKETKPLVNEIEKIFKKYFPNKDLYELENFKYFSEKFIIFRTNTYLYRIFNVTGKFNEEEINKKIKEIIHLKEYSKRKNFKLFTDEDILDLSEASMKFDIIKVIKILRNHGWRSGDSKILNFSRYTYKGEHNEIMSGLLGLWIDDVLETKKLNTLDIEIRIPSNVNIDKNNCTIYIFDGIAEASGQSSLLKLPDKYYKMYNIVHVEP